MSDPFLGEEFAFIRSCACCIVVKIVDAAVRRVSGEAKGDERELELALV
jgi:hypothetical protein